VAVNKVAASLEVVVVFRGEIGNEKA